MKLTSIEKYTTDQDIDLYTYRNTKFKTNLLVLYIIQPLEDNVKASKTALLPNILFRGSDKYPERRNMIRKLEELYGASLNVTILKRGENQIIQVALELVNDNYLSRSSSILDRGIEFMNQFVFNPLVDRGGFVEKYFRQEKGILADEIKSLINNKHSYALERCIQEMCRDEAFGVYKLGNVNSLDNIDRINLYNYYQQLITRNPISIFVVGDVNPVRVREKFNSVIDTGHKQQLKYNKTQIVKEPVDIKEYEEVKNVQQGKLVLGFRTGITREDKLYYSLLVYNGILGGFPHSKLFKVLREKNSLAYYVQSNIESTKGLLLITSGIRASNYKRARQIITEQLEVIRRGNISKEELSWTKKGLINQYRSIADSNRGLVGYHLLGLLNNKKEPIQEVIKNIKKVRREDVIAVANKIKLDTIYLLHNGEDNR